MLLSKFILWKELYKDYMESKQGKSKCIQCGCNKVFKQITNVKIGKIRLQLNVIENPFFFWLKGFNEDNENYNQS